MFFSSAYAFTPTCKFFGFFCGDSAQISQNSGGVETQPQAFSFTNFFDQWKQQTSEWKVSSFFGGNVETPVVQTAQQTTGQGETFSPNTVNTSDFGVNKKPLVTDNGTNLLSIEEILKRKGNMQDVLNKCANNDPICIAQVAQQKGATIPTEDKLSDPKNTNPITPGSDYGGPRTSDNLTGTQSPNYDSGEENHINSGPLVRGVEDSQIKQSVQNYNGSQYFVNRGTGSCADYGIDVGGSCPDRESYKSDFKATMSNLCSNLTGKRLKITSGNRSAACNARVGGASGSSHMSGLAMDTRLDNYTEGEKVIIVMYLAAQGFNNFGGYGPNGAMHFDMRSDVNRWGPNYSISSCESRLFPDYFRKAMSIMGSEPCQRDYNLRQKAINALNKMGKSEFAKPANNKASQSTS